MRFSFAAWVRSWCVLLLTAAVSGLHGAAVRDGHVVAELVSSVSEIAPGKPFRVGLRLTHDPHWHSYWINPGTGYPTSIEWTLPEGWTAGEIEWPTPKVVRDRAGTATGNGYEDTIILPVTLTPPADLAAGGEVRLRAKAAWLMCETTCVPGEADVAVAVRVGSAPVPETKWAAAFSELEAMAARPPTGWDVRATATATTVTLQLQRRAGLPPHDPGKLHFFARDGLIDYAALQPAARAGGVWTVTLTRDAAAAADATRLVGELISENGFEPGVPPVALALDVPLAASGAAAGVTVPAGVGGSADAPPARSLLAVLGLAFLGGLVLNLMPCVFPVLGVKILGFVQQAGSDRRKVALHGMIFAAGVLISFWVLAGALLALRAGGEQLGWGFQLQDPRFVFALAALLLLVALNLAGVFEVGLSAVGVGADLTHQGGATGTFFSGVLATVVATPCSAPFLAPALGSALSLPPASSFLVFTSIAIGLATPYLLLSLFPAAVKVLPRPGAWMETFKQAMSFPMFAATGALVWVLAGQLDDFGLLFALLALVLIALAAWVYGRFLGHGATGFGKGVAWGTIALSVAGAGWLGWPRTEAPEITWEAWSREAVQREVAAGRTVYVDFTARWCATCQTNKKAVFSSSEVLDAFRDRRIVTLRADWTNRDPAITEELRRFNRSAIPFNLLYLPGKSEPVALPELLTPGIVLEALGSGSK